MEETAEQSSDINASIENIEASETAAVEHSSEDFGESIPNLEAQLTEEEADQQIEETRKTLEDAILLIRDIATGKNTKEQKVYDEAARWIEEAIRGIDEDEDWNNEDIATERSAYFSLIDDQEGLIPEDLMDVLEAAEQMIKEVAVIKAARKVAKEQMASDEAAQSGEEAIEVMDDNLDLEDNNSMSTTQDTSINLTENQEQMVEETVTETAAEEQKVNEEPAQSEAEATEANDGKAVVKDRKTPARKPAPRKRTTKRPANKKSEANGAESAEQDGSASQQSDKKPVRRKAPARKPAARKRTVKQPADEKIEANDAASAAQDTGISPTDAVENTKEQTANDEAVQVVEVVGAIVDSGALEDVDVEIAAEDDSVALADVQAGAVIMETLAGADTKEQTAGEEDGKAEEATKDAAVEVLDDSDSQIDDQEPVISDDLINTKDAVEQMIEEVVKTFPNEGYWVPDKEKGKKDKKPTEKLVPDDNEASLYWKCLKNIKGYQIEYSLNKDFSKSKKKKINKIKDLKKFVKKLKAEKKYFARVRIYAKCNKKDYHSTWSKVKTFRT